MIKNVSGGKIAAVLVVIAFAIVTWLAFRTPTQPTLPMAATTTTASATASGTIVGSTTVKAAVAAAAPAPQAPAKQHLIIIAITSPTSSDQWTIGAENTISWSKAAGITGQLYLVNATSGVIAGWIQQNIAPNQTYFPWNARSVFLSHTSPAGKDVLPGEYVIKMLFASPDVPPVVSAPFFIIAAPVSKPL